MRVGTGAQALLPARALEPCRPHGQGTSPRARSASAPPAGFLLRASGGLLPLLGPHSEPPLPQRFAASQSSLRSSHPGFSRPPPLGPCHAPEPSPLTLDTHQAACDPVSGPSALRPCHARKSPPPARPRDTSPPPSDPPGPPPPRTASAGRRWRFAAGPRRRERWRDCPGKGGQRPASPRLAQGLPKIQNQRLRSPSGPRGGRSACAVRSKPFLRVRTALVSRWLKVLS